VKFCECAVACCGAYRLRVEENFNCVFLPQSIPKKQLYSVLIVILSEVESFILI
jgi:hypothetical protein